ncbi:MAG TPA: M56 family metallopeptidase, partial [Candidatus Sumerlaeota bacterium]|nr:M56 family metallopeptidase [Candidatus Sumerlaeota bacterium]
MIFQTLLQNGLTARLIAASLDLCLMAGFIGLVILVFRIQAPRLKAMLWLLVLAKPLLVLAVGSPLPFFRISAAIADPVRHNRDLTVGSTLDSLLEEQLEKDRHRATSAGAQSAEGAWTARVSAGDEKAASPVPLVAGPVSWDRIIAGVWLSGVVLFLGLILHGHYRIHRIFMRSGTPGDKLLKGFIETAGEMGIRDIPTLRLSDEVDSPALAGFVRPVIFLPSWLGENVEPSRIMWILRHELMHWKMKDPLALLFRRIAEALFFFHPAVWMVGK